MNKASIVVVCTAIITSMLPAYGTTQQDLALSLIGMGMVLSASGHIAFELQRETLAEETGCLVECQKRYWKLIPPHVWLSNTKKRDAQRQPHLEHLQWIRYIGMYATVAGAGFAFKELKDLVDKHGGFAKLYKDFVRARWYTAPTE